MRDKLWVISRMRSSCTTHICTETLLGKDNVKVRASSIRKAFLARLISKLSMIQRTACPMTATSGRAQTCNDSMH